MSFEVAVKLPVMWKGEKAGSNYTCHKLSLICKMYVCVYVCVCLCVHVTKAEGGTIYKKKVSSWIGTGHVNSGENEYEQRTMITSVKCSDRTHYLVCERKKINSRKRDRGNPR